MAGFGMQEAVALLTKGIKHIVTPFKDKHGDYGLWSIPHACIISDGHSAVAGVWDEPSPHFTVIRESINKERDEAARQDVLAAMQFYNHGGGNKSPVVMSAFSGSTAFLADSFCSNFWHWMCECLPKVAMLESMGLQVNYAVPLDIGFIMDSLIGLGVERFRIWPISRGTYNVENLIVFYQFDANGGRQTLRKNPELIDNIVTSLRTPPEEMVAYDCNPVLQMTRQGHRKIINREELFETIEAATGCCSTFLPEAHSLEDQIGIVSQAEVLVAPHGAGMALAMFMKPGSTVIELFPPTYIVPCMTDIARHLKLRWFTVPSINNPSDGPYPHGTDIMADLNSVDQILRNI